MGNECAETPTYVVQYAAHLCFGTVNFPSGWFKSYAVLGDDILITDPSVYNVYVDVMKNIGVPLQLSKCIVSTKLLEFSKIVYLEGTGVSPVSIRCVADCERDFVCLLSLLHSPAVVRLSPCRALRFMGAGFRVRSRVRSPLRLKGRAI